MTGAEIRTAITQHTPIGRWLLSVAPIGHWIGRESRP